MTISERERKKGFDEWRQRMGITRDSCLNGQFINDCFCLQSFCFSVCSYNRRFEQRTLSWEGLLFTLDYLHGVGQFVTDLPRCLRELILLLPLYEGSLTCQSLEFGVRNSILGPRGYYQGLTLEPEKLLQTLFCIYMGALWRYL